MAIVHNQFLSRPYGDGWFQPIPSLESGRKVPSLRGRMVLPRPPNNRSATRPVPTGTDGSSSYILEHLQALVVRDVGIIAGEVHQEDVTLVCAVLHEILMQSSLEAATGPVPTGTDGSSKSGASHETGLSRPYGDGWFLSALRNRRKRSVPSLRGRMVLRNGRVG